MMISAAFGWREKGNDGVPICLTVIRLGLKNNFLIGLDRELRFP